MNEITWLSHHGIKGMHWGVRNGPPYPLDEKVSRQIKKGKNEKVRVSNKEYEALREKKASKKDLASSSHYSLTTSARERNLREVVYDRKSKQYSTITDLLKNENENSSSIERYGLKKEKSASITDYDMLSCNYMLTNMLREAGPGRAEYYYETKAPSAAKNNCVKCTNTLEMRKRGYNVVAGLAEGGMLNSSTQYYWNGAVPYKEKYDNIESRISGFGTKGSGEFIARRPDGSGHSVYFENVKQSDGSYKTIYRDGQIGVSYNSLSSLYKAEGFDTKQFAQITRLDNATPNFDHMGQDSVIRYHNNGEEMRKFKTGLLDVSTGKRETGGDYDMSLWRVGY